jgi:hypothetical protein
VSPGDGVSAARDDEDILVRGLVRVDCDVDPESDSRDRLWRLSFLDC